MLALAIKNLLIVITVILIIHVALKTYLFDRKMMVVADSNTKKVPEEHSKESFVASVEQPPLQPSSSVNNVNVPMNVPKTPLLAPIVQHDVTAEQKPQQTLASLYNYILDTSAPKEPSNSDPLGFDKRMFSNIQASNEVGELYETWK